MQSKNRLEEIVVQPNKVCPVVIRTHYDELEILAFRHPLAGCQLVKGTIEPNESNAAAAVRELFEESGIQAVETVRELGIWETGYEGQIWAVQLCEVKNPLCAEWTHYTQDDGGQAFKFFWHPVNTPVPDDWHPLYRDALRWIRAALAVEMITNDD